MDDGVDDRVKARFRSGVAARVLGVTQQNVQVFVAE